MRERSVKAKDNLLSWIASFLAMTLAEGECSCHKERAAMTLAERKCLRAAMTLAEEYRYKGREGNYIKCKKKRDPPVKRVGLHMRLYAFRTGDP
jgi:predicted kinase